ncbi:uncharacterized protein LOC18426107 isoform X1 [Amborella trichopoda]|uniref:Uncharacterized protein n=2 Tax=Amborella trichopoda TaxID=13333 RepID=W1NTZ8_AMBTC|nr:uncharacterized protein LOC18426107 isoform X1 [Amborella trichopoda]ERM98114.1 hypothetical protein AMTR_s00095p00033450 [Amborella trichopoda]|eukprot:XP_006832836.1 uncharacterized protein LOC18426107 isoform X1 [Amborella trichopoda]
MEEDPIITILEEEKDLSYGYKLVPWQSWDQWNFVREKLLSSSPASVSSALEKIVGWRSRGCLPISVSITAAIVEIQQRDPFFSVCSHDNELDSEEILAMAYSMAIMRLVNGFVEQSHKKMRVSIADAAEAIGLPRLLIDIRHECAHRELPSLQLLRHASVKALDWLKSYYWEPQKNAVPDVHREIRARLLKMALCVKYKQELSSKSVKQHEPHWVPNKFISHLASKIQPCKSTGLTKRMSRISMSLVRLHSAYPLEVVTVLLDEFLMKTSEFSDEGEEKSGQGHVRTPFLTARYWKEVMLIISRKKPQILVTILGAVFEKIITLETIASKNGEPILLHYPDETFNQIRHLASLSSWLLKNIEKLRRPEKSTAKTKGLSSQSGYIPKETLKALLGTGLQSLAMGDALSESALILSQMLGNDSLIDKVQKLSNLHLPNPFESSCPSQTFQPEVASLNEAVRKLELLKQQRSVLLNSKITRSNRMDSDRTAWSIVKSWNKCPIGMLPCQFSSSGIMPVLERESDILENNQIMRNRGQSELSFANKYGATDAEVAERGCKRCLSGEPDLSQASGVKKMRKEREELPQEDRVMVEGEEMLDEEREVGHFEGRLLVGGIHKLVEPDELTAVQSAVRIFNRVS